MDDIDRKILEILQEDSMKTAKEMASKLSLTTTPIYERIKKLEKEGYIDSYIAVVNKERVDRNFVVFCHVKLIQHSQEFVVSFEREVKRIDEVLECYHLSGDYDYLLKVIVKDMGAFREFMVKKLTSINHIGSTHSMFVINEVKYSNTINF